MSSTVNKATCRTFLCALAFASLASGQVVERGRTFADLTASHPCDTGLTDRIARVTDCDAADDVGDGGGAFQCWVSCDGSAPWVTQAIGAGGGGGLSDGDYGDVAVSGSGAVLTVESGTATTAGALAANGANCSAGSYPLGVDASGAAESCTAAATGTIGGTLGTTDNGVCRADSTGGVTAQGSPLTISDVSGVTTTLATITPAATTGASVAGQALAITASPAVASTDTAGAAAGGSVTITAGAAARNTSGNANGGDINLVPGSGIGTGTAGQVFGPVGSAAAPGYSFTGDPDTGIYNQANRVLIVANGTARLWVDTSGISFSGAALGAYSVMVGFRKLVEANTAGSGAPNVLDAGTEITKVFTNEGSTAKNYHTLTGAAAGESYTFCVQDADGMRVVAASGDTIRVIDKVTAAAGYVESTTIGSCVELTGINATEWFATSVRGTWTDGTFTYDDTSLTTP